MGMPQFKAEFPNAMSRVLLACDEDGDRSWMAAEGLIAKFGYTQLKIMDGGVPAYNERWPLTDKDKVKWAMSADDRAGPDTASLMYGVNTGSDGYGMGGL